MAHNHRGQPISDPFLNIRNQMIAETELLSQRNAGLMGTNYDPEQADYDEAVGPADRRRRPINARLDTPSEYVETEERMHDRKGRGEN